jgi:hypothetical protein
MDEKKKWLATIFGEALEDDQGFPFYSYRLPSRSVVDAQVPRPAMHVAGNSRISLLSTADGANYPYFLLEEPVALCGVPLSGHVGGGRLFVSEGGRVKPVVGPDDPEADHSNVETARVHFGPTFVDKIAAPAGLVITQRVLVSLTDVPAVVVLCSVLNNGEGARWVTLYDLWDLTPFLINKESRVAARSGRWKRVFKSGQEHRWSNSCLFEKTRRSKMRIDVRFPWNEEGARKMGLSEARELPGLQCFSLTRNCKLLSDDFPESLEAVWPPIERDSDQVGRRLVAEMRFQPQPGERQFAAHVIWLGTWETAKTEVRKLLPIQMLVGNEGLLWRKKRGLSLVSNQPSTDMEVSWESGWDSGLAQAALWQRLDTGYWAVPPGGKRSFLQGCSEDTDLRGLLTNALIWCRPRVAEQLINDSLQRALSQFERLEWGDIVAPFMLTEMCWLMKNMGEYLAVHSAAIPVAWADKLERTIDELTQFLSHSELYGDAGLVTTQFADPFPDPHAVTRLPPRKAGKVGSVRATAFLVHALESAASYLMPYNMDQARELAEIATTRRQALVDVIRSDSIPRWLLEGEPVLPDWQFYDHWSWLLLCKLSDEVTNELLMRIGKNLNESWKRGMQTAERQRQGQEENIDVSPDRLLNALMIQVLGGIRPALAYTLFQRFSLVQSTGDDNSDRGWTALFAPPQRESLLTEENQEGVVFASFARGVAGLLGRLGLAGIHVTPMGIAFHVDNLLHVSIDTPVLELRRSRDRISGVWQGVGERQRVILKEDPSEAHRWKVVSGAEQMEASEEGELHFKVQKGETWTVRKN